MIAASAGQVVWAGNGASREAIGHVVAARLSTAWVEWGPVAQKEANRPPEQLCPIEDLAKVPPLPAMWLPGPEGDEDFRPADVLDAFVKECDRCWHGRDGLACAFADTYEAYVTLAGDRPKPEGETATTFGTPRQALDAWEQAFIRYAEANRGVLYWRARPRLEYNAIGRFYVYARLLISAKPIDVGYVERIRAEEKVGRQAAVPSHPAQTARADINVHSPPAKPPDDPLIIPRGQSERIARVVDMVVKNEPYHAGLATRNPADNLHLITAKVAEVLPAEPPAIIEAVTLRKLGL